MCSGRVGKQEIILTKYHTERTGLYFNSKLWRIIFLWLYGGTMQLTIILIWTRHSLQASIASTHRHLHVFYQSMIMSPQSLEVPKIKKKKKHIFFLFCCLVFETSSDCDESNVYHLKKYHFHLGVVHRGLLRFFLNPSTTLKYTFLYT